MTEVSVQRSGVSKNLALIFALGELVSALYVATSTWGMDVRVGI